MAVEVGGYSFRDNVVIKSPTDRRLYMILRLPNGLTVIIVHDPEIFPQSDSQSGKEEEEGEGGEEEEEVMEEDEDDDDGEGDEEDEDEDEEEEEEDENEGLPHKKRKRAGRSFPTKKYISPYCHHEEKRDGSSNSPEIVHQEKPGDLP